MGELHGCSDPAWAGREVIHGHKLGALWWVLKRSESCHCQACRLCSHQPTVLWQNRDVAGWVRGAYSIVWWSEAAQLKGKLLKEGLISCGEPSSLLPAEQSRAQCWAEEEHPSRSRHTSSVPRGWCELSQEATHEEPASTILQGISLNSNQSLPGKIFWDSQVCPRAHDTQLFNRFQWAPSRELENSAAIWRCEQFHLQAEVLPYASNLSGGKREPTPPYTQLRPRLAPGRTNEACRPHPNAMMFSSIKGTSLKALYQLPRPFVPQHRTRDFPPRQTQH